MNSRTKITAAVFIAVLVGAFILFWAFSRLRTGPAAISYSQFIDQVQAGKVLDVRISAGSLGAETASVRLKDGTTLETLLPLDYSAALDAMQHALVNVEIHDVSNRPTILSAAPFLILLAIWIFFVTAGRPLLGPR